MAAVARPIRGRLSALCRKGKAVCPAALWLAAAGLAIQGCLTGLPTVNIKPFGETMAGDSPTCNWYASAINLKTYWGDQEVLLYVSAYLPDDWQRPGDGVWRVKALNAEGKPIPFLGVLRKRRDESGAESTTIVPRTEGKKLRDCLYIVIDPNITAEGGKIKCIRPICILCEIRDGAWKPFRVKIPLIPERRSELTPMPEQQATLSLE